MQRYNKNSVRTKRGEGFEKWLQEKICIPEGEVASTMSVFERTFTKDCVKAEIDRNSAFYSEIDNHYGDLHVMFSGKTLMHISCKSTIGSTISITNNHLSNFTHDLSWFAFARVDGKGIPLGDVIFVPSCEVQKVFQEKHRRNNDDNSTYIGMQHFLFLPNTIIGIKNFKKIIHKVIVHNMVA